MNEKNAVRKKNILQPHIGSREGVEVRQETIIGPHIPAKLPRQFPIEVRRPA